MSKFRTDVWKSRNAAVFIAAIFAFACSQILVGVHSAKYGDAPHDHFGQACVLSLAAPGGDKFVAAASFIVAVLFATWVIAPAQPQNVVVTSRLYSFGPRGPPLR